MSATLIDPAAVAAGYRAEVAERVAAWPRPLRIAGLLAESDGPAATYARYAELGCRAVGIEFERVDVSASDPVAAIARANADERVNGVFLYYPIRGQTDDRWLRELVDPRKDVEGMHSFWSRCLYENRRFVDAERTQRAILPCTPLAILKLLQHAGLRPAAEGRLPLEGVKVAVINRSDIVGRPLSAMLANDGATVFSFDVDGAQVFEPAVNRHTHAVVDSDISRAEALAAADVVITGVPDRGFERVRGDEIRPGAICMNFASVRNFDDSVLDVASAFVPRVGPMTVTMAMRNLVRLATGVQR